MKKWKRVLAGAMAVMMLIGLSACGEKKTGQKEEDKQTDVEKTVVTMTYWNPAETVQPLLDLFEEKLPDIKVEYNYVAHNAYSSTVRTKLLSGNGDDIVAFDNAEIPPLAKQGILEDMTELTKDFEFEDGDYVDGKVYMVPMNSWYEGIYYNKDIFEKNNIEVPTTYSEFLGVCEKLQSLNIKPFTIGAASYGSLVKCSLGYVQAEYMFEGEGMNFNEKFMKGEAKMADCLTPYLEQWSEIVKKGYLNSNMLGITKEQAVDEFAVGMAAMYPSGTWAYESFKQKNANLNFGLMPYMGSKPENTCLFGGSGGGYCVNARSKNKEATLRVMEVIASPEGQKALCQGNPGSFSQRKDAEYELPEEYALVKDTIEAGRVLCSWDYWTGSNAETYLGESLQTLLLNPGLNWKTELEKIDQKIQTFIEKQE